MLLAFIVLAHTLQTNAAQPGYTIDATVNDLSYGKIGLGGDCNGTKVTTYHETTTEDYDQFPNTTDGKITACPEIGYAFSHWLVNGTQPASNSTLTTVNRYYPDWGLSWSGQTNYYEAVFIPASSVVVISAHGSIGVSQSNDYAVADNNSDEVTISFSGTNRQATVTITPDGGYVLDPDNPVTITGSNVTISNFNSQNNTFTLTLNGSDQVNVNYLQQYNVDIYSTDSGTASVNGSGITVNSGNNSDHINLTAAGTNKTVTVYSQAPQGKEINSTNPVITTGGVVYNNDYNNGQFTLTLNGAGTATINYGVGYTVNIHAAGYDPSNDQSHGDMTVTSDSNYIATPSNSSSPNITIDTLANGNVNTTTFKVIPDTGYFFDGITSANGTTTYEVEDKQDPDPDNPWELILHLTGDDDVTVNFTPYSSINYTVSVNIPAAGSIDISNSSCATTTNQSFVRTLTEYVNQYGASPYQSNLDLNNNGLTDDNDLVACVDDNNYRFSHWLIDGYMRVSSSATLNEIGPWPTSGSNHTLQAVFVADFYDVTYTVNDANKGEIWMNNTQSSITMNVSNGTRIPVLNGEQSLVLTVHCNGDCTPAVVTNSLMIKGRNGYRFHHFEISNNNAVISSSNPSEGKYGFTLAGTSNVVAVFGKYVNYTSTTIGNTTINPIDPSSHQVKNDEDIEGTVTGATIDANSIPVGAAYMGWADENDNIIPGSDQSYTFVPSGAQLQGEPTYHPVFEEIYIYYTSGTAGETSVSPKDGSGNVKTSEGGLSPTGVTINSADIPVGYTFVGWANENDVIVSNSMSFIPSGASQIYSGVSYHPVFSQALVAIFSSNDGNTGQLGYIGWDDKCNNGNSLVTSISFYEDNQGLIDLPYNEVKACPVGDNVFLGWSLDGGNTLVSNAATANKWESWTQFNGHNLNITAVFAPGVPYMISVNIPEAGSIDAQGGNCADSTKKTNQSWTAYLIEDNGTKTLDTYVSDSSVFQACVDDNDYQFDYWQIDNTINASTTTTLDKTNSGWPNQAAYHSLRAMFGFPITYLPGVVDSDTTKTVSTVDPSDTSNTKSSELSSSITGVTYSSADLNNYSNAKFAGWEEVKDGCLTPNCPIISTSETFVPTGDQIYIGATYRPVFVTDANNYTLVISADPDAGYISYWSGSQNQWVGRTDNGEFHVATVNGYVNGGIRATPRKGYVFDHWEHNGNTICTINDSGCVEIVANEVAYQGVNGAKLPTLVAYFVPLDVDPLPFTGSFEIWLIIGGGIGLVAIPSMILIIGERKEKKQSGNKGGEKGGNKMKKLALIISVCAALTITSSCFAESGTISGSYIYDGEAINGVNVSLRKVANYDGSFRYVDEYLGHERDVGRMTNSALGEYGEELAQVEAPPIDTTQTVDGNYSFSGFEEGIYLVTFEDKIIGDYTYSALPIVLTIPDANFNYNITLETKLEKSCPECVEPEPEPPEKQTNTHDVIQLYIKLFIILIFIETLTLFVIIKERKREDSNESK